MTFRLATTKDLKSLKTMYSEIADNLTKNNIKIYWSEFYPYEEIEAVDINNNTFYVLEQHDKIVGGINLSHSHEKADNVSWNSKNAKAIYISKLGVNTHHLKKGIGTMLIENAKQLAKKQGTNAIRLFVVDINTPAINLYEKNGFLKIKDTVQEYLDYHGVTLTELGYELQI